MKPKLSVKNSVKVGATYRHYKGNLHYLLAVGKHSETLEDLVVYISLYNNPESKIWIRPLSMFNQTVEHQGKTVKRFRLVAK